MKKCIVKNENNWKWGFIKNVIEKLIEVNECETQCKNEKLNNYLDIYYLLIEKIDLIGEKAGSNDEFDYIYELLQLHVWCLMSNDIQINASNLNMGELSIMKKIMKSNSGIKEV